MIKKRKKVRDKNMKIADIIIKDQFKTCQPMENKIISARHYYEKNGKFKSSIAIYNGALADGYITYLLAKEFGIEDIEVVNISPSYRKRPTIYVFGYHPEDPTRKEFVWRLRFSEKTLQNYDCEIEVGDLVPVNTRCGNKNIIVTRIETLDNPPVNGAIKVCTLPNGYRKEK